MPQASGACTKLTGFMNGGERHQEHSGGWLEAFTVEAGWRMVKSPCNHPWSSKSPQSPWWMVRRTPMCTTRRRCGRPELLRPGPAVGRFQALLHLVEGGPCHRSPLPLGERDAVGCGPPSHPPHSGNESSMDGEDST